MMLRIASLRMTEWNLEMVCSAHRTDWIPAFGAVEKPHSDGWSMGQSLIFVSQHGQTSLTVAPLVVNLDFFNSPFRRNDKFR